MNIDKVTLTGADDRTIIVGLFGLSRKYPFVEWGILFSGSKSGVSRYPSSEWVAMLRTTQCLFKGRANISAHLCGNWVREAKEQKRITFFDEEPNDFYEFELFDRVQLNCYKQRLKDFLNDPDVLHDCATIYPDLIIGGNYANLQVPVDIFMQDSIRPLFDASGGHGKSPRTWPTPLINENNEPILCGYAGGLGPDNLVEELQRIEEVVGDASIWIDMESKLRNDDDEFDLGKCEEVLQIVKEWQDGR